MALRSDLFWVLFGRIATALIAIASLRIMTSLLDPKDFGIYALLIAFQGFCGLFLINPVGQHINRHTHAWWDDGTLLKRLMGYNRYLMAVSAGIAIVVACWWMLYPSTGHSMVGALLSAFAVSAMVYLGTWNGTFVYILNMLGFRSGSVAWMMASSITGLAFSSMLAYEYHTGIAWVLGQAVGMAVGAIGAGIILRRHQAARVLVSDGADVLPVLLDRQTILTYCLPLATATGLMWLQNTGYRFWVGGSWGVAELGILVIGLSISAQIWTIIESLSMQFLNPYFFRHITEVKTDVQKSAVLSDMVNVMWPLYAVLAGFNMLFASSLLVVLTDARYHAAITFVMLGVLIEFSRCTANLWSYASQIERRTTQIILPYGLGALVVWLGALGVTYSHGDLIMLAGVLVISGVVICVVMIAMMQRILPVVLDMPRWMASSGVLIICLALVVTLPIQIAGVFNNIVLLLVGLSVSGGCMLALLWRNPALSRLLAVSLRSA